MSKGIQDTFIDDDDEEESCPLCVEEFDLTDKGFKPCPCGYQICQFCYNNVKNNMNGLCPACRRPYNDKDIEYKVITPEEAALHRARQAHKQKKTQQALQKEKQRAEADSLSRKHLAGLRVVQKNLVYVTGLSPTLQEEELLQTLRGEKYFGQYGKIVKIVVSKARDKHDSVGVYVTYDRKEDALSCISAVDGAHNGDRILRAQFGTTKYCSAYLRGDTCMNRNCMFLHEPGEAGESYSRADLSALNAGSTQNGGSHIPPPQSQQPLSAAQPMARLPSDQAQSPANTDRPALPSSASWASKPPQTQPSRAESRSTSGTVGSPAPRAATPAQLQSEPPAPVLVPAPPAERTPAPAPAPTPSEQSAPAPAPAPTAPRPQKQREPNPIFDFVKGLKPEHLCHEFYSDGLPQADADIVSNYPPMFEPDGGAKRRLRKQKEEEQRQLEREQAMAQQSAADAEENPEMSGSLQLGGEPEERPSLGQSRAIHAPGSEGTLDQRFQFGGVSSPAGISERGLTPQQHQQLLLQTMKSPNVQGNFLNNHVGQPNAFQQPSHGPGHQRNVSRFSFANDSSASTAVKPVANQKLMSQQSSMMPPTGGNIYTTQAQPQGAQFFTSNVQGPPPGLKTSGTPPVSGGMTFGQGHGFTTGGLPYGAGGAPPNLAGNRNANEEMMRDLLRGRDAAAKQSPDTASQHPEPESSRRSTPAIPPGLESHASSRRGTPTIPPGFSGKLPSALPTDLDSPGAGTAESPSGSRRATPTIPPGFAAKPPTALPDLGAGHESRPGSRAGAKRAVAGQVALPLRPGTPGKGSRTASRAGSPIKNSAGAEEDEATVHETPTKKERVKPVVPKALEKEKEKEKDEGKGKAGKENERPVPAGGKDEGKAVAGAEQVKEKAKVAPAGVGQGAKAAVANEAPEKGRAAAAPAPQSTESVQGEKSKSAASANETKTEPTTAAQAVSKGKAGEDAEAKEKLAAAGKADAEKPEVSKSEVSKAESTKPEPSKLDAGKRKHPGKLDITAAVEKQTASAAAAAQTSNSTPVDTNTPSKQRAVSQTPSTFSVPASPSASASPVIKNAPRTLRVVQTPKTEASPATTPAAALGPAAAPVPTPAAAAIGKLPSRQPSVASMNLPGTPSSEQVSISDNISLPSTSQSRANSPPPPGAGRVGTAPVRAKTKNQQKKDRREQAKAAEEEKIAKEQEVGKEKAVTEEPAQEAIVSRKKKAKKEKEPKPAKAKTDAQPKPETATRDTTPTASRPPSPGPVKEKKPAEPAPRSETKPSTPVRTPQQPPQEPSHPTSPSTPSPAQMIADLRASDSSIQRALDALFRTSGAPSLKPTQPITPQDLANPAAWKPDFNIKLTRDEVDALLRGSAPAVQYGGEEGRIWDRGLVTPGGAHLRALTQELERRFLDLENWLRGVPEQCRFRPTKPGSETPFPGFDLEGLRREFEAQGGRGVSVMEAMVGEGGAGKKGAFLVDEATRYVNEFVMPPSSPPAGAGGAVGGQGQAGSKGGGGVGGNGGVTGWEGKMPTAGNLGEVERALAEARRASEEREGALRRVMKRNRKVVGL